MDRSTVHKLAVAAVTSTLVLIAFGGYTRGSGSGFGCKDRWPLCENGLVGGYLPRLEPEMLVEWTHRWIALLVGILSIVIVYAVYKAKLDRVRVLYPSVAAVITIGIQAWFGRLVVKGDLDRDLVAIHLFISMIVAALFVFVAIYTRSRERDTHRYDPRWSLHLGVTAISVLGVLVLGSIVHNVFIPGWPFLDGGLIPDLLALDAVAIHWFHRVVSALVYFYLFYLAYQVWRGSMTGRPSNEKDLVLTSFYLYSVNVGLGLLHVFTEVSSSWVVSLHLGVAGTVWAALVAATLLSLQGER